MLARFLDDLAPPDGERPLVTQRLQHVVEAQLGFAEHGLSLRIGDPHVGAHERDVDLDLVAVGEVAEDRLAYGSVLRRSP